MILNKIKEICKKNKDKIFYKNNDDIITYKELWKEANVLASKIPYNYKEPIIVYGNKQKKVLISFVACLISGNAYISINNKIPESRIKKIIKSSNSKYVINCTNDRFEFLNDISILEKGKLKYSDNYFDPAYIIYTSGSAGEPKGVLITKKNLNNFINWIDNVIPKQDDLIILNQADFSFDLSVCDLYFTLTNGFKLISLNDNDIFNIYNKFYEEKINLAVMTPTFAKLCLRDKEFNGNNLKHLKTIFFCGERLEKSVVTKLFERFPNINIINAYGPTEATCAVSAVAIKKEHLKYELLPVGQMNNNAVDILIKESEIILEGYSVCDGYINIKSDNFYKKGNISCYKTGDIGYIKDNYLFCSGRMDNQIKYKGYRIEMEEIEENLNNIDEINDCLVTVKVNDDGKVILLKALVSINQSIDVAKIKQKLRKKLPEYMIPKNIEIVDEILRSSNFKKKRSDK